LKNTKKKKVDHSTNDNRDHCIDRKNGVYCALEFDRKVLCKNITCHKTEKQIYSEYMEKVRKLDLISRYNPNKESFYWRNRKSKEVFGYAYR